MSNIFTYIRDLLFGKPVKASENDLPAMNEYYVEFQKEGKTLCMFGVLATDAQAAKKAVEVETKGNVTQVAIRTPEQDCGMPSYEIVRVSE